MEDWGPWSWETGPYVGGTGFLPAKDVLGWCAPAAAEDAGSGFTLSWGRKQCAATTVPGPRSIRRTCPCEPTSLDAAMVASAKMQTVMAALTLFLGSVAGSLVVGTCQLKTLCFDRPFESMKAIIDGDEGCLLFMISDSRGKRGSRRLRWGRRPTPALAWQRSCWQRGSRRTGTSHCPSSSSEPHQPTPRSPAPRPPQRSCLDRSTSCPT